MALQLLRALPRLGIEVDCCVAAPKEQIPESLHAVAGLEIVAIDTGWRYDRWYSRGKLTTMATGLSARALAQERLVRAIAARHAARRYDALYQFSQPELLGARRLLDRLPPVFIHPEVHAAGELRWHEAERRAGLSRSPWLQHQAVWSFLRLRTWLQAHDAGLARTVVCPSEAFSQEIQRDYGVPAQKCAVVSNPVDLVRFQPPERPPGDGSPRRLLFVSRMAVRKGVEMVVDLSHRLGDLVGEIEILVAGGPSQWSDYRHLLDGLNPATARYLGQVSAAEIPALWATADMALQPSHYEPFALTVAEALASGVPVVASSAVGAAEEIEAPCCRRFATGDSGGFERAVRDLLADMKTPAADEIRSSARREAEERFSEDLVAQRLGEILLRGRQTAQR